MSVINVVSKNVLSLSEWGDCAIQRFPIDIEKLGCCCPFSSGRSEHCSVVRWAIGTQSSWTGQRGKWLKKLKIK